MRIDMEYVARVENELQEKLVECVSQEAAIESLEKQIRGLESMLENEKKGCVYEVNVSVAESALAMSRAEFYKMSSEAMISKVAKTAAAQSGLQSSVSRLEESVESFKSENAALKAKFDALSREYKAYRTESEMARGKDSEKIKALKNALKMLRDQIVGGQVQIVGASASVSASSSQQSNSSQALTSMSSNSQSSRNVLVETKKEPKQMAVKPEPKEVKMRAKKRPAEEVEQHDAAQRGNGKENELNEDTDADAYVGGFKLKEDGEGDDEYVPNSSKSSAAGPKKKRLMTTQQDMPFASPAAPTAKKTFTAPRLRV
eukprot:ANDGO_05019.mRNA.1 hypothetical protein